MLEVILELLISKFLGRYISNIDSKNLRIGLWSGKLTIDNVAFKQETIDMLNLPLKLQYSLIKKLKIQIPWDAIYK